MDAHLPVSLVPEPTCPLDAVADALRDMLATRDLERACAAVVGAATRLLDAACARIVLFDLPDVAQPACSIAVGEIALLEPEGERLDEDDSAGRVITSRLAWQRHVRHLTVALQDGERARGHITLARLGAEFDTRERSALRLLAGAFVQHSQQLCLEAQVREERDHFKQLVERLPVAVFLAQPDEAGTDIYMSPQVHQILGYTAQEMVARPNLWLEVMHPDDRERVQAAHLEANASGTTWDIEYRAFHRDGHIVWIHEYAVLMHAAHGGTSVWQGVLTDVTRRRMAEDEVRIRESQLHAVMGSISDPFYAIDNEWRLTFLNDAMATRLEQLYGVARGSAIGRPIYEVLPSIHNSVLESRLRQAMHERVVADFEIFLGAHKQWISVRAYPSESGLAVYVRDITAQRHMEARLTHQAFHDVLTGLPNQTLLRHHIEQALRHAQEDQHHVAVLMIDINNFRVVNDSLGHASGDELLVALSQRLVASVRANETVAHFGGDAFVVLLPSVHTLDEAVAVAERLLEVVRPSFTIQHRSIQCSISVGIAFSEDTDGTPGDLLRRADLALFRAKSAGRNSYAVFGRELHEAVMRRLDLEGELRRAVDSNGISVHWQPIFDLRSGQVRSFEALARWRHPERGSISPEEFVPLAEATGIIVPLGRQMLRHACRQAVAWGRQLAVSYPTIAVNLSSREFREPDVVVDVADTLRLSGLPPHQLIIEITESLLMDDIDDSMERLHALKQLGIGLAIDDFGTGYSSLAYLHRFPVDVLKIDRRFIVSLEQGERNRIIAGAAISLAHALGVRTVGEGVETFTQLQHLRALGADMAQGYYLSRPVSGTAILQRHRKRNGRQSLS